MWQSIQAWFKSKGGFEHVVAASFGTLMLAYAAVPSFHQFVNNIHAILPGYVQEGITAGLGIYAWYRTSQKPAQPQDDKWK